MKKLLDFGEKIGGARKDLWVGGLTIEAVRYLNDAEKVKYVTKDNVWPMASCIEQADEVGDDFVAYWQRKVRRLVHPKPIYYGDLDQDIENYISAVSDIREHVMACRTEKDIWAFETETYEYSIDYWSHVINITKLHSLRYSHATLKKEMEKSGFPVAKRKERKQQKIAFIPPHLNQIKRDGPDYRHGRHITPERWQKEFNFRGIEFGNWTSQKDRQVSMDYAYDAFHDLAEVLQVDIRDIAFDGNLALAFGARGHSSASAHYEPLREVINLTKMHGDGCLAHEHGHALDDRIGKFFGVMDLKLASETKDTEKLPKSFLTLIHAMRYNADGTETEYYRGSKKWDGVYKKSSNGYWASTCEMFARAYACYVIDTLNGKSDYLVANADCFIVKYENQYLCAIPQGDERETLNTLFDQLIEDLKKAGLLHEPPLETSYDDLKYHKNLAFGETDSIYHYSVEEDFDGQLVLSL